MAAKGSMPSAARLLITPPKEGEIHDLLVFIAEKHGIEWVPPRRPETTYERNMEANPLMGSSAVAIRRRLKFQISSGRTMRRDGCTGSVIRRSCSA